MLTLRNLLAAIACTAAVACNSGPEERDPEELFEIYRESTFYYNQAADFERAEVQALNALSIHPDDLSCNLILCGIDKIRGKTKDLLKAEYRYREMSQQDDFRVQLGLAEVLERLGSTYDEAAAAIDSGQRKTEAPDPAARVIELREMSVEAWEESRMRFHNVLATKPSYAGAINGLQRVHALQGDFEGSLVWTNRLLDLVEIDLSYYRQQLNRENISIEAETDLRNRMTNSNDLAERAYLLGASVLHQLDRNVAELDYLTKASLLAPHQPNIWSRKAQAEMGLERYDQAIISLDTFLSNSKEAFDSLNVQRAYELRDKCVRAIEEAAFAARLEDLQ